MEQALLDVGLSPNEAKIYRCLVENGKSAVSAISKVTGVHRRNVYDSLERLVEKGLLFQVLSRRENLFEAVHPDKLVELIKEKEARLEAALPALRESFHRTPHTEDVFIYKGVEGFKNYLRDVLRVGEDMYLLGAKGFWFDARLTSFTRSFLRDAKKRNITFHSIFDHEVKTDMGSVLRTVPKPHRFLPEEYSTRLIVNVFGDRVVTFTGLAPGDLGSSITLFVTVNEEIANGYRTWFKFFWERCQR